MHKTGIIQSYLTNRSFSVNVNGVQSSLYIISVGVPLESILADIHEIPIPRNDHLSTYANNTAIFTMSYKLDTIHG